MKYSVAFKFYNAALLFLTSVYNNCRESYVRGEVEEYITRI